MKSLESIVTRYRDMVRKQITANLRYLTFMTLKEGQIKNPGIMGCSLMTTTHNKN
jgi:hypothetical protein